MKWWMKVILWLFAATAAVFVITFLITIFVAIRTFCF